MKLEIQKKYNKKKKKKMQSLTYYNFVTPSLCLKDRMKKMAENQSSFIHSLATRPKAKGNQMPMQALANSQEMRFQIEAKWDFSHQNKK